MKKVLAKLACVGILASGTVGLMNNPAAALGPNPRGDGFITRTCTGRIRAVSPVTSNGRPIGAMYLYYSPANGGTYCAQVKTRDWKAHRMSVEISKAPNSYAGDKSPWLRRATKGVGMKRSARRCVNVAWSIDRKSASQRFCGGGYWYASTNA